MATGACGINCDVCRLNLLGLCTTCGSGTSPEAEVKLATQKRVLGNTCAILSCCAINRNGYCLRDCAQFPCENHTRSTYPFGAPFLEMQHRRRQDWMPRRDPLGRPLQVPEALWKTLDKKDLPQLSALTQAATTPVRGSKRCLAFPFMDLDLALDLEARQLLVLDSNNSATPVDIPLLTLLVLTYFGRVDRLFPMGKDLISTKDMDQGNYFSGPQELIKEPLMRRFTANSKGLKRVAATVRAKAVEYTETAWAVYPFPRLAVYYLFRGLENAESPRLSILFDRGIHHFLSPPMVWELVNLTNARLLSN